MDEAGLEIQKEVKEELPYAQHNLRRAEFYKKFKEAFPPNSQGLYIAPGMDPVPLAVFDQQITYFSHPSDGTEQFEALKQRKKEEAFGIYKEFQQEHGPFPHMKGILGDINHSGLPNNQFDFLIIRGIPSFLLTESFENEVNRLVKSKGSIVVETDQDEESHAEFVRSLLKNGYQPSPNFDQPHSLYRVYYAGVDENNTPTKYELGKYSRRVITKTD